MRGSDRQRLQTRYGSWAVITGASDGIGRAFARELAAAEFGLILVARRATVLEELAAELRREFDGLEVEVVPADVATQSGRDAIWAAARRRRVGLFVGAAGFGTSGPFLASDPAAESEMLRVNCEALMLQTHRFAHHFAARERGGIILLSSIVAYQGVPRAANYAATKAWVQSFAEALRPELAPHGVDVLAVAPGPVASGFADRADMRLGQTVAPEVVARQSLAALGRRGTVAPGTLSKVLTAALSTAPRRIRVRIMQRIMRGFTQHQTGALRSPPGAISSNG